MNIINDNATGTGAPTVIKTGADAAGADAYNLKIRFMG